MRRARRCPAIDFALIPRGTTIDWGPQMADHSEVAYTTADGNDYLAHEPKRFVRFPGGGHDNLDDFGAIDTVRRFIRDGAAKG